MKTKYIENEKNLLLPPIFDLFGDVIVTHDEVYLWVNEITRGKYLGRHFDWYVKNYDVVGKIKQAKANFGTLERYLTAANDDIY